MYKRQSIYWLTHEGTVKPDAHDNTQHLSSTQNQSSQFEQQYYPYGSSTHHNERQAVVGLRYGDILILNIRPSQGDVSLIHTLKPESSLASGFISLISGFIVGGARGALPSSQEVVAISGKLALS